MSVEPKPVAVERRKYQDLRLVVPAVCGWLAAALTLRWIVAQGGLSVVLGVIFLALGGVVAIYAFANETPKPRHARYPVGSLRAMILMILLAISLAGLSSAAHAMKYRSHPIHDACQTQCVVAGMVDRNSRLISTKPNTWITHLSLQGSAAKILVMSPTEIDARIGDRVTVTGRIKNGLSAPMVGTFKPNSIEVEYVRSRRSIFRANLDDVLAHYDRDIHGLIAGMSIGDFSRMPPTAKDSMVATGTSHLTAISGTHLAILMGTIHVLIPGRSRLKILAITLLLAGLVAVVGATPSIIRASSMALIPIWGLMFGRGGQAMNSLALVALAWVIVDPWLAVSMGFILSTLSTAGVLLVASGVKPAKIKLRGTSLSTAVKTFSRKLWFIVAIPAAATISTAPALLNMTGKLAIYSVPSNVLVSPFVAPTTLAALATAVTAQVDPALARVPADVAAWSAHWILAITQKFAGLPHAELGQPGALIATILAGLIAVSWIGWRFLPLLVSHRIPNKAVSGVKQI